MSIAVVNSRASVGIDAPLVSVEVHISNGLPGLSIVGLPETTVKESRDRVRSALLNSHFEFPTRRITINLAPADLPKEGGRFDLPIAIGILAASGQIPKESLDNKEFLGELALSGDLRPVRGILPASIASARLQRQLVLPLENAPEASLFREADIRGAKHLLEVSAHLHQREIISASPIASNTQVQSCPDINEVIGQHQAKRCLEIAAAGFHNLLLVGPPGTGKTMLASRLPGLMPQMSETEALAVAAIYSITGHPHSQFFQRPFRSPHHTASATALVGGGSTPKPGEISLAHNGILFLDEFPEFSRQVLEVLREPMESGEIHIARAKQQVNYPARFQLVAAMNPCPCGYLGEARCHCTPDQVNRYRGKISGPLLDRIDLQIPVGRMDSKQMTRAETEGETSAEMRQRITAAQQLQLNRANKLNAHLNSTDIRNFCRLTLSQQTLMASAMDRLQMSARAFHRTLKVARTIADLAGSTQIADQHLIEALSYRLQLEKT